MSQYTYQAKVTRVVDGDTVDCDVDLGFRTFTRIRFRLLDVDTPERGQDGFRECTDKLRDLLKECEDLDGNILIHSRKTGKYGRWLATIVHPSMRFVSRLLSEFMVDNGWVSR